MPNISWSDAKGPPGSMPGALERLRPEERGRSFGLAVLHRPGQHHGMSELRLPATADPFARDVYTVSRLNLDARTILEDAFSTVWIEGEISNLAQPRSGHIYFTLKDENCQVRCAMFRMHNRALSFPPENGMQVLAHAKVSLYAERGEFQLIVQYMEEAGAGALRRAFDALKSRLDAEGLFDAQRKRPLPTLPRRIGIVTSPTGAAVRDILSVLGRRFPAVPVMLYPVPVQGTGAGEAIARMLDLACERNECEVLILARGGGSLEDLWAFNEEVVARAIHRATIPVVTGVGHEVDFTIADLAADLRAPTPSAAAESVVPDAAEWAARYREIESRLFAMTRRALAARRGEVRNLEKRMVHPRRRLFDHSQRLDGITMRLARAANAGVRERRARLATLAARHARHSPDRVVRLHEARCETLERRLRIAARTALARRRSRMSELERALGAFGPQATLERGYSILIRADGRRVVRDAGDVQTGERLHARLAHGALDLDVATVKPDG